MIGSRIHPLASNIVAKVLGAASPLSTAIGHCGIKKLSMAAATSQLKAEFSPARHLGGESPGECRALSFGPRDPDFNP
jgi:hypothetical protein